MPTVCGRNDTEFCGKECAQLFLVRPRPLRLRLWFCARQKNRCAMFGAGSYWLHGCSTPMRAARCHRPCRARPQAALRSSRNRGPTLSGSSLWRPILAAAHLAESRLLPLSACNPASHTTICPTLPCMQPVQILPGVMQRQKPGRQPRWVATRLPMQLRNVLGQPPALEGPCRRCFTSAPTLRAVRAAGSPTRRHLRRCQPWFRLLRRHPRRVPPPQSCSTTPARSRQRSLSRPDFQRMQQ